MVKVKEINWLNDYAKEATVAISNGEIVLMCFSQPFTYSVNDVLSEPLYCYSVKNVVKTYEKEFILEKQNDNFAYFIRGELISFTKKLVKVYDFVLSLENNPIPNDLADGDIIEFTVQRIDIY